MTSLIQHGGDGVSSASFDSPYFGPQRKKQTNIKTPRVEGEKQAHEVTLFEEGLTNSTAHPYRSFSQHDGDRAVDMHKHRRFSTTLSISSLLPSFTPLFLAWSHPGTCRFPGTGGAHRSEPGREYHLPVK